MKNRIIFSLVLMCCGGALMAQTLSSDSSNYFVYGILAVVIIVFLGIVVQVSDNLLAIEARQAGADNEALQGISVLPRLNELFAPRTPEYVTEGTLHTLRRGHDILLEGKADQTIKIAEVQVRTFALQPANFIGMSPIPKVEVEPGQQIKAGDVLFFDKKRPEIKYVSPVSGEVIAVNRGEKRSIKEITILADKDIQYRTWSAPDIESSHRDTLVQFLLETGGWTLLRQRPFDIIPDPEDTPRDIFISTFDTAPLAPDLNVIVSGKGEAFQKGLDVLGKLTDGKVYLGLDARGKVTPSDIFTKAQGVEKHWFRGKHPAGNVGIQIHHIKPVKAGDRVWTLGVQEVITLGALFTENRFNAARIVALTGAELQQPMYVKTYIGANLGELLKGNLKNDHIRIVSGDVLSGKQKSQESFLNFYDDQVTVIEEGDDYALFGWLLPRLVPSVSRALPSFLFPNTEFKVNTNTYGEKRAFVVTGQYEAVLPMDIYPQHLMKAILANDFELMEGLGIYELSEEDIALCEFVCTSKQPLQAILREGLEVIREQS
jgi:Na+-transporting NADH:ubiquinone oxidoreductase subunit A